MAENKKDNMNKEAATAGRPPFAQKPKKSKDRSETTST